MQLLPQCVEQGRARLDCDRVRVPVDDDRHSHRLLSRISGKRLQRTGYGHAARDEAGAFDELASVNGHSQCLV
jgi:hypothetical protein